MWSLFRLAATVGNLFVSDSSVPDTHEDRQYTTLIKPSLVGSSLVGASPVFTRGGTICRVVVVGADYVPPRGHNFVLSALWRRVCWGSVAFWAHWWFIALCGCYMDFYHTTTSVVGGQRGGGQVSDNILSFARYTTAIHFVVCYFRCSHGHVSRPDNTIIVFRTWYLTMGEGCVFATDSLGFGVVWSLWRRGHDGRRLLRTFLYNRTDRHHFCDYIHPCYGNERQVRDDLSFFQTYGYHGPYGHELGTRRLGNLYMGSMFQRLVVLPFQLGFGLRNNGSAPPPLVLLWSHVGSDRAHTQVLFVLGKGVALSTFAVLSFFVWGGFKVYAIYLVY